MPQVITPVPLARTYTCPFCDTTSVVQWFGNNAAAPVALNKDESGDKGAGFYYICGNRFSLIPELADWAFAECTNCGHLTVWHRDEMVYPERIPVDEPNADMPDKVKECYLEAASVLRDSPRSAAALLRLGLQHLLPTLLGEKATGKLYADITEYSKSAPVQIAKALDTIRLAGNESVHPGEINMNEDPKFAEFLFVLMNMICEESITRPRELEEAYQKLPETRRIIKD